MDAAHIHTLCKRRFRHPVVFSSFVKSIASSRKSILEDAICMGDTARKNGKNGIECFRPDKSPKNNLLSDLNIL